MARNGSEQPVLRVAIIAADAITASALHALLSAQGGLLPVATMAPPEAASLAAYTPDAILWDFGWSVDSGYFQNANVELPEDGRIGGAPVLGLVADPSQAVTVWRAGVRSILLRSESPRSLDAALQATSAGLWVLSRQVSGVLPIGAAAVLPFDMEPLSGRELEVLQLLAEGLTNRGVAARLAISEHTVKFHVNSILGKLGAESRTDAVVRATRGGLILL